MEPEDTLLLWSAGKRSPNKLDLKDNIAFLFLCKLPPSDNMKLIKQLFTESLLCAGHKEKPRPQRVKRSEAPSLEGPVARAGTETKEGHIIYSEWLLPRIPELVKIHKNDWNNIKHAKHICHENTESFLESHFPHLANTEKCSPNTGIVLSVFQRSCFWMLLTTYLTTEETEAQRGQELRQN